MLEYLETLERWSQQGREIVLCRVIKAKGSSPRPIGSVMLINDQGNILGSVSGGCVEGEVVKKSHELLSSGRQSKNIGFGVSDEDAWSVGLPCGGGIFTFIQRINLKDEVWVKLSTNLKRNIPCAVVTSLEDNSCSNWLYNFQDETILGENIPIEDDIKLAFQERSNKVVEKDGIAYFIHLFPRKPLLLAIGAAHITVDLVAIANDFGFDTVVIDPRGFFTTNTVFKSPPSQILTRYPSEVLGEFPLDHYTYCAILSHDPKVDDNAIEYLLNTEVGYIGALGSKSRHQRRARRLLEAGYSQEDIDRIHGPIGEPIHSITAKEIALAIMAQIIKVQNQHQRKFINQQQGR